jgi:tetratricopeptide (TPR) repeat protein
LGNVFDLQDQFTESVVAAIEPKLQLAEIERLKHKPASNLDAYDLLLRAQQCEYEFSRDSHAAALRYLGQALAIDPLYAPAMALAALCHAQRADQSWMDDPEAKATEALRLAVRTLELGKDDANVFWMTGYTILRFQMDQPRARELIRHSLELNPNSAVALAIAGDIEANLGNARESSGLARPRGPPEPA